jgi:EAL domain-containing protein (putative c-di-GMP-specific phosphodiesterase class I)
VLRLKKLPFDMAFLDAQALKLGEDEDDKVLSESLVNLLRSINLTPYACSIDADNVDIANDIGCEGYSIKHEIPKGSFATGEVV